MEELLSIEQVEAFRKTFKLFDSSGEDRIPLSELGTVMRAVGHNPSAEELLEYAQENDPDNTGQIDYDCFQALVIRRLKRDDKEEELMNAFKAFDAEATGMIKSDDFREAFLVLNRDLSEEEVEEMMKIFDSEGTGEFAYMNLVKQMVEAQKEPSKKDKKKAKKKKK